MISRIGMVILPQPDLGNAVAFYKTLGLLLKFHLKDAWAEFELSDGTKVCLVPTQEAHEKKTGIVFAVDDMHTFYDQMKNKITFLTEPIEKVHGIMTSVKDPGGNIIELYQATPEKVQALIKEVSERQEGCCRGEKSCACKTQKSDKTH